MQFIIIKTIFLLLMNVGVIIYSLSANSLELLSVNTKKPIKAEPTQLQSFKIINLISDIKYDYLHNMARYVESKMANINVRTLVIIYPVGKKISGFPPSDIMFGATHEVVLTKPQINEVVLRTSAFFEEISCDNSIVLKFDIKLQKGTGNIIINNLDGITIDIVAVDSSNVIFNDNTVTIYYNQDKLHSNINSKNIYRTLVNIIIPAGAIKDMAGNVFTEVSTQETLPLFENSINSHVSDFNKWLQIGGGGANTLYSPFLVAGGWCDDYRLVVISVDTEWGKAWGGINKVDLQRAFFHEAYHSFQQDLAMCGESGDNDEWVVEGAAEYFALYVLAWAQGRQEDFVSLLLETALSDANFLGKELVDAGGENWGLSYKGMGVLRLMIERGWLDESQILDGSLFHDCASVKEFNNSNPKIQFIKNNWHQIEVKNGVFQFKEFVLKES